MTAPADETPTRAELLKARTDIQRQIEILQTPSRPYDLALNDGMIERLRDLLREIEAQLRGE